MLSFLLMMGLRLKMAGKFGVYVDLPGRGLPKPVAHHACVVFSSPFQVPHPWVVEYDGKSSGSVFHQDFL